MRQSSNPVFKNLDKEYGRYATFGNNAAGGTFAARQTQQDPFGQAAAGQQAPQQPEAFSTGRSMTIDDVVIKTAITLGVLTVAAIVSYVLVDNSHVAGTSDYSLMVPLILGGGIIGFVLAMIAIFANKTDRPAMVLAYAAAEGVFLGAFSFLFANFSFGEGNSAPGNAIIVQALVGTFGVFFGMLVVYKTGAIRVTPKFTKMVVGALFGATALIIVNLIASIITPGGLGLRSGGPIAIIFSLVCIGVAAFCFLIDFDQADKLIAAGAPEKTAWSVAFGLTLTLVWLYTEILRLLSYFMGRD